MLQQGINSLKNLFLFYPKTPICSIFIITYSGSNLQKSVEFYNGSLLDRVVSNPVPVSNLLNPFFLSNPLFNLRFWYQLPLMLQVNIHPDLQNPEITTKERYHHKKDIKDKNWHKIKWYDLYCVNLPCPCVWSVHLHCICSQENHSPINVLLSLFVKKFWMWMYKYRVI